MKLMKVRFTEWRDAPARAHAGDTGSELEVASRHVADCTQREIALRAQLGELKGLIEIADTQPLRDRRTALAIELDAALRARRAALSAEHSAGEVVRLAMKAHPKVGSDGYQVLNDEGTEMLRVVDAAGKDLPASAVYGYEIIDQAPPLPAWATAGGA